MRPPQGTTFPSIPSQFLSVLFPALLGDPSQIMIKQANISLFATYTISNHLCLSISQFSTIMHSVLITSSNTSSTEHPPALVLHLNLHRMDSRIPLCMLEKETVLVLHLNLHWLTKRNLTHDPLT
jgi:hypothetical protein